MSTIKTTNKNIKPKKTTTTKKTKSSTTTKKSSSLLNKERLSIAINEFPVILAENVKFPNRLQDNISSQKIIDKVKVDNTNNKLNSKLEQENKELKEKTMDLESKYNSLLKEIQVIEQELNQHIHNNNQLTNDNQRLNKDLAVLKDNEIKLNNKINHLNQVNSNLTQQVQNLNNSSKNNNKANNNPPPIPNDVRTGDNKELLNQQKIWDNQRQQLEAKIQSLTQELENERQQLINKLQSKSKQAQEMIDQKLVSLEEENKQKINDIKFKVYEDVISKFLDPINLFEQTIISSQNNPAISNYLQGFNMIVNMFKDNLSLLGADEIDIKPGDEFNPNWMSAFDTVDGSGLKPNHVVKVVSKGFAFNGKVLKFASVVVSK